ncbi:hypothetical protein HanPSC8_Chr09g0396251 [Helianthus annuus]|nr:hypothetical protein HanPSC8_Chr09g0396251 [Helianthus annuus]
MYRNQEYEPWVVQYRCRMPQAHWGSYSHNWISEMQIQTLAFLQS